MKHIIEFSQIEFFKQHGYLELEGLLSDSKLNFLKEAIKIKKNEIEKNYFSSEEHFFHFHDLFTKSEELKKFLTGPTIAHILTYLAHDKYFRICFDQLIYYPLSQNYPNPLKIDDLSFQNMKMGLLIHISGEPIEELPIFPKTRGSATFFDPKVLLDLTPFYKPTGSEFLLIGFGSQDSRYRFKETDPHTHFLKNYGYVFGDPLSNQTHPIVFEK